VTVLYRSLRDGRFRFDPVDDDEPGAEASFARIHLWSETGIDTEIDGHRVSARVTRAGDQLIVQGVDGDITFTERPRFSVPGSEQTAGGFVAQMPGKVLELRVAPGDRVRAGDTVLVLEAMKMEHPMRAPEDGVVSEVHVVEGEQVEAGTLLLVVEPTHDAEA
jgi:propionyl-CoA carboxylase alpha chain